MADEHIEDVVPIPLTPLQMPSMFNSNNLGSLPPNSPPTSARRVDKHDFWVSPPVLDPEEKQRYRALPPDVFAGSTSDDEDEAPFEVLGEIHLGTDLYYWVMHKSDIIHRHFAKDFRKSHRDLLDVYIQRKDDGTIDKFDTKSPQIHPDDRIPMTISISARKSRATRTVPSRVAKRNDTIVIDASDDEDDDSQTESDSASDDNAGDDDFEHKEKKTQKPSRRSARAATTGGSKKPNYRDRSLSPVKARSNPKRGVAKAHDDDYFSDGDGDNSMHDEDEMPQPKIKKKVIRGRLSRPAYGNIRHVADLSDDDSDDGTAPLHAHRDTCEKCRKPAAHVLLTKYYTRTKKGGVRKKSHVSDDFEEEGDEEQGLLGLGGWVRCIKCCVTAHWRCIAKIQRDEIMKAARSKDKEAEAAGLQPRKRDTLDAYDTTEFICGACIKGGICMFCYKIAVKAEAPPELKADAEEARAGGTPKPTTAPGTSHKDTMTIDNPTRTSPPAIVVSIPTPIQDNEVITLSGSTLNVKAESLSCSHDGTPPPAEPQWSPFRCITCKRLAHYEHLPQPDSGPILTPAELATYYQTENEWNCTDCVSYVDPLDKILAWRPYPVNAVEPSRQLGELPDYRTRLPREYLVKWTGKSYRRLTWVPHMWLVSTNAPKLKNFLATGPKVQLLEAPVENNKGKDALTVGPPTREGSPSFLIVEETSRGSSAQPPSSSEEGPSAPLPDAERRIPPAWMTVDRVLEVRLWDPTGRKRALQHNRSKSRKGNAKGKRKRVDTDDESGLGTEDESQLGAEAEAERIAARERGEEPSKDLLETVDEWEERTRKIIGVEEAGLVIWAFLKWDDLVYEEATWDSPPGLSDPGYAAFENAFERFLRSRTVFVAKKDRRAAKAFDDRPKGMFEQQQLALKSDPELGQEGKLMDFQLKGVNWLFRNWWRHQPSILADEMGLGKTVQIVCLVGHLTATVEAFPVLVVVPNSTITNWLREFARWAPKLRVVPFNGEAKSREIIRDYELYHNSVPKGHTNLKFHVLVTTYETLIGKDFTPVFKSVPRWELLIIDEGQRLKSDASLLFKRLNELHTEHRILMTGTPLNNNIRELFNLMNFLDPAEWRDLKALEEKYETLTEELLNELHEALKPYFLRRTKADVLKLPPKNEVIVPVSMTAIQKEVYKSLLSQNTDILGSLAQPSSRVNNVVKRSNLNNLLMQLRKCLQHPYLVSRDLEPTDPKLPEPEIHKNLLGASTKLRFLHSMLPKLKARGHRVLLFSQFVMALDIIEDFLTGEKYKFLRLDGDTKQAQRQKDMDTFNRPDSDVFIFLLSTRAGGVGINLWSADTVIIFDPDFNPHQDLQAISRSHRYGQTKTVLVFKLMVKGAAEERIVQTGKKKLALDHLIVQKMDEDATDDVQSILTFGAKAIFEGSESQDINYTDADIDNLITRTEREGDKAPETAKSQPSFGFAKLWVVEKDAMEEIPEDAPADGQNDGFWADVLARAAADKAKAKAAEVTGRGAKRRAAVSQKYNYDDGSPAKPKTKKRRKNSVDSDIEYNASETDSGEGPSGTSANHTPFLSDEELSEPDPKKPSNKSDPFLVSSTLASSPVPVKPPPTYKPAFTAIENQKRAYDPDDSDDERPCGLCQTTHGPGTCFMTQNPTNLVEYRSMLMSESTEPIEMRRAAVRAIDEHLTARGLAHLLKGQAHSFGYAKRPRNEYIYAPFDNTLKRPVSPSAPSPAHKKAKHNKGDTCAVCGGTYHLVKSCPVVKEGPTRIRQLISRLERDPQKATTVNILQSLIPKIDTGIANPSSSVGQKTPLVD